MMKVWRLVAPKFADSALDGIGASQWGGRWNFEGTRMVYLAESLSLAAMELLVHMDISQAPGEMSAIQVEIPDDLLRKEFKVSQLPPDWGNIPGPEALKEIGTKWAKTGKEAILLVPSAVIPQERLVLINPEHPDAKRITHRAPVAFHYDPRLRP